jgi:predicted dehydrogenase
MPKSGITRRDFVRLGTGTVVAAAAAKTTLLDPAHLWAQQAPEAALRFASIGMGVRGCEVLKAALQNRGTCVGISDLYDGRQRAGHEIVQQDILITRNYHEILDRKDVEAVIVAVPDHLHRRIVNDACAAGKDVYCEKPMSHNVEDGFSMVAAAQKNKRILQIGSQRVSSVAYLKAREIYSSGRLGEVTAVEAHSDRNSPSGAWVYPIPPDASDKTIAWDGFIQDAPNRPYDPIRFFRWRCFKDYGEGSAGDLYVHLISGIQFITGTTTPPISAHSVGGIFRFNDGREFPDLIETLYEYPKFQAFLRCNQNNENGESIVFYGTKGTMTVSGNTVTVKPQDTAPHPEGYSIWGWPADLRAQYLAQWQAEHPTAAPLSTSVETELEIFQPPAGYNDTVDHVANFFNSVRTRKPPVENEEFGNSAAIACHMANHSYFNKSVATWDAGSKKIKG